MNIYPADNQIIYVGFSGDGVAVEAWGMQLPIPLPDLDPNDLAQAKRRWFIHRLPIPALPKRTRTLVSFLQWMDQEMLKVFLSQRHKP